MSHETIYSWIYSTSQKPYKWFQFLPRHKAKRGLRTAKVKNKVRIKDRVSICDRPKEINKNKTLSHWEYVFKCCCLYYKRSTNVIIFGVVFLWGVQTG